MPLASALGLGMLAGARLYATVFAVGLLLRFNWVALPPAWQHASVLADTRVLIVAGIACAVEFVADKIPWVDSAWDSIHTFIRPIGAALMASSLLSNVQPAYQVVLFLLAGGMALSGHSAKAATRLALNHSPEPFTNLALSLGEDAFVAGGLYMVVKHPWVMAVIALLFFGVFAWLAPRAYRVLRAELAAIGAGLRHWTGQGEAPKLTSVQEQWLADHSGSRLRRIFSVIATADVKGLRNTLGTLCLSGHEAVFFSRRWWRPVEHKIGPLIAIQPKRGLLLDELLLVVGDGRKVRFDLLAGQMDSAREEASHYRP